MAKAMGMTFIVDDDVTEEQLHEILCKAIYEGVVTDKIDDVIEEGEDKANNITMSLELSLRNRTIK